MMFEIELRSLIISSQNQESLLDYTDGPNLSQESFKVKGGAEEQVRELAG